MTQNSQGTTARPKLDDKAFEAFIRARRPASPIWSMSGLDGYLTALIIGPKFIDPRKWIPELTGPDALNLPMETTEHRAVQTIVAEYNRISASLSETPKDHRPRFTRIDDQTFDIFDWDLCFLLGTGYAPRLWQPVLRGHAVTGDIIAPIRKLGEAKRKVTSQDAAAVAEALVNIRTYFSRSGQSRSSDRAPETYPSIMKAVGHSLRSRTRASLSTSTVARLNGPWPHRLASRF